MWVAHGAIDRPPSPRVLIVLGRLLMPRQDPSQVPPIARGRLHSVLDATDDEPPVAVEGAVAAQRGGLRERARKIVDHPRFNGTIQCLILLNCLCMALADPTKPGGTRNNTMYLCNLYILYMLYCMHTCMILLYIPILYIM